MSILWPKYEDLQKVVGIRLLSNGELFQVHGSKFKLHPVCYLGQASVLRITHGVFFFRVSKVAFNRFFAALIKRLVLGYISGEIGRAHV